MRTKLLSALYSTLLMGGIWLASGLPYIFATGGSITAGDIGFVFIVMMYTGFGNLVYGIPVSFLSDWLSKQVPAFRFTIAVFVHISMAVATYFVIEGFAFYAVIAALFFFTVEEIQHRKLRTFKIRTFVMNGIVVIVLLVGVWGFSQLDLREKTHNQFLIPEGYEGTIVVMYDRVGEPELAENEEGYSIIPVKVKDIVYTYVGDEITYGEARTSSEMPEGIMEDSYYYIADDGERTPIDEECIYRGVSGTGYLDGAEEVNYEILQVTNSKCGMDFMRYGSDRYDEQENQVMNELSNR